MYTEYYGLKKLPFSITPDPEFVFMSSSHHEALAQMLYGIQERKSLMVVTGEVGVGKTTMIYTLLSQLDPETKVAILFDTHVDSMSLYRYLFADFGIEEKGGERAENVLILRKYLEKRLDNGKKTILIIDEGHNMSEEIFNEIVFLTNLETRTNKLLQIILVGQPELKFVLNSHKFRQLKQRINLRTEIKPLTYKDAKAYILHRLSQAGAQNPEIFTEGAIDLVYRHSKGIPRLINTICDNALLLGMARKQKQVAEEFIQETIEDLMQLNADEEPEEQAPKGMASVAPVTLNQPAASAAASAAPRGAVAETTEIDGEDAAAPSEREEVRVVRRIVQLPDGRQVEQKVRKVRKIRTRPRAGKRPPLPAVVDLPEKVGILRISHKTSKEMIPAIIGDDPAAVRQYHVLWNKLISSEENAKRRVFLVTSSVPQEGKTVTSINFAATIAQEPTVRVLLIDADLRAPKVNEVLGIDGAKNGLATVLQGKCDFSEAFYNFELPRLFVMPAGEVPQDPFTYLISPKMSALLERARGLFHYVVIDSPPVIPIPDTVQLADMVDGVILAVKARVTPREVVSRTLDDLYQKPIIGLVLNDIEGRLAQARGGRYGGYGYGYGYGKYGYGYGRYGKPSHPESIVEKAEEPQV
ncbi:MAG: polysaccharide biosynthesis tyrosine autokinase [Myxococcales bacterium]|nr:polysaccharide biosynthesis tyrosine autokinase [Myxococcales bacterium]